MTSFGFRSFGYLSSVSLLLNNISSTTIARVASLFQSLGYVVPCLVLFLVAAISVLSSLFLAKAIASLPRNRRFRYRIEFARLAVRLFPRWVAALVTLFVVLDLALVATHAVVHSSRLLDDSLAYYVGRTCGLILLPSALAGGACVEGRFNPGPPLNASATSGGSALPARFWDDSLVTPFVGGTLVWSLGFSIVLVVSAAVSLLRLSDTSLLQIGGMLTRQVCLFIWVVQFSSRSAGALLPAVTSDPAAFGRTNWIVAAVNLFNFVTTVPTWLNEKAPSTGVVSAVFVATAAGLLNSIMVGSAIAGSVAVGAATNMTDLLQVTPGIWLMSRAALLAYVITNVLTSISSYLIIIRYNLVALGAPRLLSSCLPLLLVGGLALVGYATPFLDDALVWATCLASAAINFAFPVAVYLTLRNGGADRYGALPIEMVNEEVVPRGDGLCDVAGRCLCAAAAACCCCVYDSRGFEYGYAGGDAEEDGAGSDWWARSGRRAGGGARDSLQKDLLATGGESGALGGGAPSDDLSEEMSDFSRGGELDGVAAAARGGGGARAERRDASGRRVRHSPSLILGLMLPGWMLPSASPMEGGGGSALSLNSSGERRSGSSQAAQPPALTSAFSSKWTTTSPPPPPPPRRAASSGGAGADSASTLGGAGSGGTQRAAPRSIELSNRSSAGGGAWVVQPHERAVSEGGGGAASGGGSSDGRTYLHLVAGSSADLRLSPFRAQGGGEESELSLPLAASALLRVDSGAESESALSVSRVVAASCLSPQGGGGSLQASGGSDGSASSGSRAVSMQAATPSPRNGFSGRDNSSAASSSHWGNSILSLFGLRESDLHASPPPPPLPHGGGAGAVAAGRRGLPIADNGRQAPDARALASEAEADAADDAGVQRRGACCSRAGDAAAEYDDAPALAASDDVVTILPLALRRRCCREQTLAVATLIAAIVLAVGGFALQIVSASLGLPFA